MKLKKKLSNNSHNYNHKIGKKENDLLFFLVFLLNFLYQAISKF